MTNDGAAIWIAGVSCAATVGAMIFAAAQAQAARRAGESAAAANKLADAANQAALEANRIAEKATVLSERALRLQEESSRTNLALSAAVWEGVSDAGSLPEMVQVQVVNRSGFEVTVTKLWFRTPRAEKLALIVPQPFINMHPGGLPCTIQPRRSVWLGSVLNPRVAGEILEEVDAVLVEIDTNEEIEGSVEKLKDDHRKWLQRQAQNTR